MGQTIDWAKVAQIHELLNDLEGAGSTGLDLSPGDPLARRAAECLRELRVIAIELKPTYQTLLSGTFYEDYDAACTMVGQLRKLILALGGKPSIDECDHDWVSARNEVITAGEICSKCFTLRPEQMPPETGMPLGTYGNGWRDY